MKMTRRVAMKAGLVSAVSVLSPPALRADELQYQGKKGIIPMSHHLDTPLAAQNGQLFIDDLYVFSGDDSTVFIMDVNSNITGVHVKPGFHHEARYEFKVHFDGADFESLTYRVSFDEAGPDGTQAIKVHALTGKEAREDSATGELVLEGRTGETASAGGRQAVGGAYRRFVLRRSLAAREGQRGGKRRDRGRPVGLEARGREEQLYRHDGRIDRARGLSPASPTQARRSHWRLVRHQTRHRRRRLAADQPRRVSDDVADLLAGRRSLHQSRQHQAPVRRLRRGGRAHRRAYRRRCRGRRHLGRPKGLRARPWRASCSPTSCTTWSGRPRHTASPAATDGRWRTTRPRS